MRPATIVGSAKGRSMTALTNALPRKSSRTSTKAMARPATELTMATISAATSVSSSGGDRLGLGDGGPERAPAAAERVGDERGDREQDEQRQVGDGERRPAGLAPPTRPRGQGRKRVADGARRHPSARPVRARRAHRSRPPARGPRRRGRRCSPSRPSRWRWRRRATPRPWPRCRSWGRRTSC